MTYMNLIKYFFELLAIALCCYGIYREKDLIRFEKKVSKYVKAFFKACYYTVLERTQKNKSTVNVTKIAPVQIDKKLGNDSKIKNIGIAS